MRRLRADTRPLYARAREAIRDLLVEQGYELGRRIPAEQALAQRLGTSRSTVREALKALEHEGLLVSRRGSGSYVTDGVSFGWAGLETLRSTTSLLRDQGLRPAVHHLRISAAPADATSAARLGLQKGQSILIVERVRTADGEPLCHVRDELAGPPTMLAPTRLLSPSRCSNFCARNTASTSTTVCVS